jgi:hypothetical protein
MNNANLASGTTQGDDKIVVFEQEQGFPQGMFGNGGMQNGFPNMAAWNMPDGFNPMLHTMQNSMPNGQWGMMPNMMGKLSSCRWNSVLTAL